MDNKGTICCSILSGMLLGSALTVLMAHKGGYMKSEMIHKKIMGEIEKLRSGYDAITESLKSNVSCNCDSGAEANVNE